MHLFMWQKMLLSPKMSAFGTLGMDGVFEHNGIYFASFGTAYGDGVYPFYEADDLHALELVLLDCKSYLADEQPLDQLLIDSGRIASIQDTSLSPYFGPLDVGPRVNIAF